MQLTPKENNKNALKQEWDMYIEHALLNGYTYRDVWESMEHSRENLWQYTTATTGLPVDEIRRLCNQHLDKMEYVKKNWEAVEARMPKKSLVDRIKNFFR